MTRRILAVFLTLLMVVSTACSRAVLAPMGTNRHLVEVFTIDNKMDEYTGTGWFLASDGNKSIIATAGHMCENAAIMKVADIDGNESPVVPIYVSYDPMTGDDVCLLLFIGPAVRIMRVGELGDRFGTEVWYTGFPNGVLSVFGGRLSGVDDDGFTFSMLTAPGASGSPIVKDGHAVSMIVRVSRGFAGITYGISSEKMMEMQSIADQMLKMLEPLDLTNDDVKDAGTE